MLAFAAPASAVEAWKLLFKENSFKYISEWCDFVQINNKAIPQDVWIQFLHFVDHFNQEKGFDKYDSNEGAWPVLMDEFVESIKLQNKQQ